VIGYSDGQLEGRQRSHGLLDRWLLTGVLPARKRKHWLRNLRRWTPTTEFEHRESRREADSDGGRHADRKMAATDGRGGLRMPVIAAKLVAAAARGGATPTRPRWWRRRGAMPIARYDSGWRVRHLACAPSLRPGRCDWRRARCGHRPLADHPMPGRRRQLRHHECRGTPVAIFEHLEQCQPRRASSSPRPNLPQFPDVAAVSLRQAQFAEQPRGRMVGDPEAAQPRLVADRGGRRALPVSTFASGGQSWCWST